MLQHKTIDSKDEIIKDRDATICELNNKIKAQVEKYNELSNNYSNIDEKYKEKINTLLMENQKYEEIIKDIPNYTISINNGFNGILQEFSKSTGYKPTSK